MASKTIANSVAVTGILLWQKLLIFKGIPLSLNHTKNSYSTTNVYNRFHYENFEQYCPLVVLFVPSTSAEVSNFLSAHQNSNHYHRCTSVNTCVPLCTGNLFWSTRPSCAITKGQNYFFFVKCSVIQSSG